MVAYKIWHDTKYFIHKNSTNELNVQWTENINDAKIVNNYSEAIKFFCDVLKFSIWKTYDNLYFM